MFKCARCGYSRENADGMHKYPVGPKVILLCSPCHADVMRPHTAFAGGPKPKKPAMPDHQLFSENEMFDLLTPGKQQKAKRLARENA